MTKTVDIIVFGATGFTGKFTVLKLAELSEKKALEITWGIAGRSKEKLENLVTEVNESGYDIKNIPMLQCDVKDEDSLRKMMEVTKVVVNCTGPNTVLSPNIVKLCIETGTHYIDISSETLHILNLYKEFNERAKAANVLVIPCCGYSSIPIETGMIYLERNFKGTLHSVECYVQNFIPVKCFPEALIHSGTWTSLVHVLLTLKESLVLKKEILSKEIQSEAEKVKRSFFFRNNGQIWYPWPGVEDDTVLISQQHLYEETGKKPIAFKAYTTMEKLWQFFLIPAMYLYYYLCYFKCFANYLINYPHISSFGYVTKEGPSEETREKLKFQFRLNGKGWETDDHSGEPTKTTSVMVSGKDPYETTAIAVIASAITLVKESSNMPKGGVLMPGAAFYKTDIINILVNNGLKFEIVE